MEECTHKKQEKKSVTHLGKRNGLSAITVKRIPSLNRHITNERKDTTAQLCATQKTARRTGSHTSKIHGKAESAAMNLTASGLQRTKSECLILKLDDMQERKGQKVHIPLKNGKNLKKYTVMYVQTAKNINHSLKTMSCLYQKAAQTILQTFSHYAEIAIAKSGLSFNIWENPELLKDKE